ncbi:hypothetical protein GCM10017772_14900 [Promicromonospora soli]|uniref:FHA domain-containing protein n=1 Tax=Promicromonospora soli TaxID=2035533 RepID=A0A919FPR8_9MICO|nr:hypothetical protein GCM10017772_14900 [Promicromonospora soli]
MPAWPYQAVDDTRSCTIVSSKRDLGDLGTRFISSLSPLLATRVRFGRVSDTCDTAATPSADTSPQHAGPDVAERARLDQVAQESAKRPRRLTGLRTCHCPDGKHGP